MLSYRRAHIRWYRSHPQPSHLQRSHRRAFQGEKDAEDHIHIDLSMIHAMIDSEQFPTIKAQSISAMAPVDQLPKHTAMNPLTSQYQSVMDLPTDDTTTTTQHDDSLYKPLLLHAEIYHTSKAGMSGGQLENQSLIDDAVIIQGRPDFSQMFSRIDEFAASRGESRIGVSICGPMPLRFVEDSIKWDTHFQVFNLKASTMISIFYSYLF